MLEKDIEQHLVNRCKEIGALCEKFTSPRRRSVPDRIITYRGLVVFLELKAPGKTPTEAQIRDHDRRDAAGATVCWTDSIEGVDAVVDWVADNRAGLPVNHTRRVIVDGD